MSYAVRKDGQGWRAVADKKECTNDETFSKTQPEISESIGQDIKLQMHQLEKSITPRRVREAVLGTDNGWLAGVDAQIAQLRAQL